MAMTTSLDKRKIRILMLEGVHPSAIGALADAGYSNAETASGALSALAAVLEEGRLLGAAIDVFRRNRPRTMIRSCHRSPMVTIR
jgi:hypothetical protein